MQNFSMTCSNLKIMEKEIEITFVLFSDIYKVVMKLQYRVNDSIGAFGKT